MFAFCLFLRSLAFFCCFVFFCLFSFFSTCLCSFLFAFSSFLCFSLFFASSFLLVRFKKFECFLHISRQLLSIVPQSSATGKLQKHEKKREFRSDPVYTNSVRNFPSDAPFSRLRPNDPSSGLTNDTREDPIAESHRPIANKNSPKIF